MRQRTLAAARVMECENEWNCTANAQNYEGGWLGCGEGSGMAFEFGPDDEEIDGGGVDAQAKA